LSAEGSWRELPGDPGLVRTTLATDGAPWVGTPGGRPVPRFARDAALDRVLCSLQARFGPQRWWPAETPFEVIVGAVLTQHTSWRNVRLALESLRALVPLTPATLASMEPDALARAIRPSGSYRVKARRLQSVSRWYLRVGGLAALARAPLESLRAGLLTVHGVGPETADAILCHAAGRATPVVDAYARRVLERHGLIPAGLPYERIRSELILGLEPSQVVFEEFHALCVRVGYDHCKPQPRCLTCPAPTPTLTVD